MAYFREVDLGTSFVPFATFREYFGFVPSLFRCQSALPRLIEAQARLFASILIPEWALSRKQKERILLAAAVANRSQYCATAHYQMLSLLGEPEERLDQLVSDYHYADLPGAEVALLDFAVRLCTNGPSISHEDVAELKPHGWTDEIVLETVLIAAWANFLTSLATGVGVSPDFEPVPLPSPIPARESHDIADRAGPYVKAPDLEAKDFAPFAFFHEQFGFVPAVFRAQALRPDVIEAESEALRLLFTNDHLSRPQKEQILGISPQNCDHDADQALLDFALDLQDPAPLRGEGFTDEQILEAVVTSSFTHFLNTVQIGLGAKADFTSRRIFPPVSKMANLLPPKARPTDGTWASDPDAEAVARVQRGDVDAFEALIHRHSRRVYRTLVGILGNTDEARDAMQDTFLKAFQHLVEFQGRSRFSTWLVSIAGNTGLQLLRERKHPRHLDDDAVEPEEGFRPQQIRAWSDDPEQLYSKSEVRSLVEQHVMRLPAKYRVVVVLRDIEQLSIEESAAALGLGIPALKSRHLRGRLMLREALTPHFTARAQGGVA